jgi:hypothetical protein
MQLPLGEWLRSCGKDVGGGELIGARLWVYEMINVKPDTSYGTWQPATITGYNSSTGGAVAVATSWLRTGTGRLQGPVHAKSPCAFCTATLAASYGEADANAPPPPLHLHTHLQAR